MIRRILSCLDGSAASDAALDAACWLGARLDARIRLFHVIDVRLLEGPWVVDLVGALGAQPYHAAVPQVQDLLRQRSDTILAAGRDRASGAGSGADLVEDARSATGLVVERIVEEECAVDLVALGQRGEHARWSTGWIGSTASRVARRSIKPVLVAPDPFRPPDLLIAGNDGSANASRALAVACELARRLDLPLRIVCVTDRDDERIGRARAEESAGYCDAHGIAAATTIATGLPDDVLVSVAGEADAPWMIIGAFGHARVREFLVGSTTASLLQRADFPLLLAR